MTAKTRVPAVDGWFTVDDDAPTLLGSRCTSCGTYAFPKESYFCRNPECRSLEFEEHRFSRTGTVWSYTSAGYQPPKPYVSADPFVPFAIAAVELATEQMVVLGQVVGEVGIDDLAVGTPVEIVLDVLYEDDEHQYLVWKWQPVTGGGTDA